MPRGTDPNWNPDDYLFAFEDIVWPGGELVDCPLELKVHKVGQHVSNVVQEANHCLAVKAEIGATLLALATVDYMAGFRHGRESSGADFIAFLAEYFPDVYAERGRWVYEHLRCGLMHNLTAINPWRGTPQPFRITSNPRGSRELTHFCSQELTQSASTM